jgi:hypothetical protein
VFQWDGKVPWEACSLQASELIVLEVLQAVVGIMLMLEVFWTEDTVNLDWKANLGNSY